MLLFQKIVRKLPAQVIIWYKLVVLHLALLANYIIGIKKVAFKETSKMLFYCKKKRENYLQLYI